ncbi:BRX1-like protein [Mya arenaria]|uniref:Ribosome biogenesis protein BRX1 homolog n=1 Tax=Mya arenaria TaxID=6604 RepID=A0ABY7FTF8_MYAAR|nr:ribosome biogenesis protein BRX1 homolog [Mya arenaria]WAR24312.1 BRX1-like protein [Mya arenaria]
MVDENMGKRSRKVFEQKQPSSGKKDDDNEVILEPVISSDEPPLKQTKWTNKQRVLVFSSRGISHRARHLMIDLRTMMPHSKAESKMDRKDKLFVINEICEMKNCNKCIYFEAKKKMDLYMWVSNCPRGPSAKFLIENVHTMSELKMTGNCLKGSRPLLSFDQAFDEEPHLKLMKELFTQTFGTPNHHPKSQPFFDHVFTFSVSDNRIWFRNYQILEEDGSLAEIGPRFVLNPIRMFEGSFGGPTLYTNPHYVSPNIHRRMLRRQVAQKYIHRVHAKKSLDERKPEETYAKDITDDVFVTIRPEQNNQNG